jgi:ABC-type uncharacterized transport system ATPase subunit
MKLVINNKEINTTYNLGDRVLVCKYGKFLETGTIDSIKLTRNKKLVYCIILDNKDNECVETCECYRIVRKLEKVIVVAVSEIEI